MLYCVVCHSSDVPVNKCEVFVIITGHDATWATSIGGIKLLFIPSDA
jgi:hypothetical protein